ncbi:hypothetical protein NVP1063O_114 [Vibrio phage 1.063.O._10N.261.45.C7]|nr:hypothetical protein NVP1063O_114 [Vibrio phage 1.063.O._10N.261.45.C7]
MKKLLTLTSLLITSFTAQATITEVYQVDTLEGGYSISQDVRPTVKIAPKSGLPKMLCKFYNVDGERVAYQNVTVFEEYDQFVLVEANLYHEQHNSIHKVVCK